MRHGIANALYAIAEAVDRPATKCEGGKLHFGDNRSLYDDPDRTSWSMNVHTRERGTRISGDFHPPEHGYTYAALHVAGVTVFLTRRTTSELLDVMQGMSAAFAKHGEGRAA